MTELTPPPPPSLTPTPPTLTKTSTATSHDHAHDDDHATLSAADADAGRALDIDLGLVSDAQLVDEVAQAIARPKLGPATSFILHAPLELLARTALLTMLEPSARGPARRRLARLGAQYARTGEAAPPPAARAFASVEEALCWLRAGISAGDVDDAEATAAWLAEVVTPTELVRALADDILPRLGAAAHGSIFVYLLPRVAPRSRAAARMIRGLVRELAKEPTWRLKWHRAIERADDRRRPMEVTHAEHLLLEALRSPPSLGDPVSNFIYPTMSLVERSGLATELLDKPTRALDVRTATRVLLRVAADSMLQDAPHRAPYGWSHCLTLPQAALGIAGALADPSDAVAVAATYVLGFRATQATVALAPAWAPEPLSAGREPIEALTASPIEAAAAVWHAGPDKLPKLMARVVAAAAAHEDAHLAKYTLACFDAASDDPAAARLYLAAAAYLGAWWATHRVRD